ncbi:alkaline phosphatase family protein [Rhizomonospora bruguierae]|uniref:sulfatase n=1 Tax=Rhizomonospora bruguierae TaxID=1581705 RepID=UPI0020BEE2C1|nr:sulfatase [Micromonospora sp. NBRC 107566]
MARLRPVFARDRAAAEKGPAAETAGGGRWAAVRRVLGRTVTPLAAAVVLAALLLPNRSTRLAPEAFLRVPVEALVGTALVWALPGRVRRIVAAVGGLLLGLLVILKILDIGFYAALARPFDPVLDWVAVRDAVDVLGKSIGTGGATAATALAALIALAVPALTALAALRLSGAAARHRRVTASGLGALTAAWIACAVFGAHLAPGVPVADRDTAALAYDRALQARAGFADHREFAAQAAVDAFRDTPSDRLLTPLRGKDVIVAFVESYGRDAVEDPEFAPHVDAVLDAGTKALAEAGYAARSGWLTSPTAGGGSWLAHSTLESGLWIDNQRRYRELVAGDRLTLNGAFRRAGWRTVGVMPGVTRDWPEGKFFDFDKVYAARDMGYAGPPYTLGSMPDQYTLSAFQRAERSDPGRAPVMAELPLISSHVPWTPIPRLVDWAEIGDGALYGPMASQSDPADVIWRDTTRIRTEYRRSIEYSLNTLVSYVRAYGDRELVLVFLGDHQPAPVVTGEGASRDVPVTIVARDPKVLDRIAGWDWSAGLRPAPDAPVWRMDAFRDRFLTAFGPQPAATPPAAPRAKPADAGGR